MKKAVEFTNEAGKVENDLETKLRDIYALMNEALVLREGGWAEASDKEFQARQKLDALIEEVKTK